MQIYTQNVYAHFLDRELRESVEVHMSKADLTNNLLLAFFVSAGSIYCRLSHIWESQIHSHVIDHLLSNRALIAVSDYPSGGEFLESRHELYAHDRARYQDYFDSDKQKRIASINPEMIARTGRTTIIPAKNLSEWSEERNPDIWPK